MSDTMRELNVDEIETVNGGTITVITVWQTHSPVPPVYQTPMMTMPPCGIPDDLLDPCDSPPPLPAGTRVRTH
jgi:hypothetical protein